MGAKTLRNSCLTSWTAGSGQSDSRRVELSASSRRQLIEDDELNLIRRKIIGLLFVIKARDERREALEAPG